MDISTLEPSKLKSVIAELAHKNATLEEERKQFQDENKQLQEKNEKLLSKYQRLLEQFKQSQRKQFGSSSEKNPHQTSLFDEPGKALSPEARAQIDDDITVTYTKKRKPVRKPLPDDILREEIIVDIAEEDKVCDCGCSLTRIGELVSEQLDIIPLTLKVYRYKRQKYACKACQNTVRTATRPNVLLPKSMASAGLVAHTIVSKYVDHLPLYRQEQIFKRNKIYIPRNSSCGWLMKTAEHCEPLYALLRDNLICYDYIQADETPVQVLKEPDRKNKTKSYMWCYKGGPMETPSMVFDYQAGRSGHFAQTFLNDFKGYLQSDAYKGYNFADSDDGIIRLGCMVHARRPFAQLVELTKTKGLAHEALLLIGKLYGIERYATDKQLSFEERKAYRIEYAKPILNTLHEWLVIYDNKVPALTKLGEGIHYMLNNWKLLTNYLLDGRLSIDNNQIENLIRPFAIGRKNWMFMGSPTGARAGAIYYSLISTCKLNGIEPYAYFQKMLTHIPNCQTEDDYRSLLPQNIDFNAL